MIMYAILALILTGVSFTAVAAEVQHDFPSRPITIIVPYTEGGGLDVASRLIAKYAAPHLGQPIYVENITLGGNVKGYEKAVNAAPDGYTIGAWANGLVTDALLIKNAPYRYTDVKPVCMFANDPHIIVINREFAEEAKIKSLEDLIEYMNKSPKTLSIGMGGNWTTHDFLRMKMERIAKIHFNRIPFLGGAPALQAVANGNCHVATPFVSELLRLTDREAILPLAVAYQDRVPQFPNLPSVPELGYPGMTQSIWRLFALPKGTPIAIRRILQTAFHRALLNPDFMDEANRIGVNPFFMEAEKLEIFLEKEYRFYSHKIQAWLLQAQKEIPGASESPLETSQKAE